MQAVRRHVHDLRKRTSRHTVFQRCITSADDYAFLEYPGRAGVYALVLRLVFWIQLRLILKICAFLAARGAVLIRA